MRRVVSALIASLLCAGCASPGPRDVGGWVGARGADLLDTGGLRLTFGPGLGLYLRVTEYFQFGYMALGPSEGELPRPEGEELRAVPCLVVGLRGRYGGAWWEESQEFMLPALSSRDTVDTPIQRRTLKGYVTPHGEYDDWRHEVGVGFHAVLIGLQIEMRPVQAVDFAFGLFGVDLLGDDIPRGAIETAADAAEGT